MWELTNESVQKIRDLLKILDKKAEQWHDGTMANILSRLWNELNRGRKVDIGDRENNVG